MKWDKEIVDSVYKSSNDSTEFLIGLYRKAFGKELWDRIEKVIGWPKVGKDLSEYIFSKMIEKDLEVDRNVFAGGVWLNSGFSTDRDLEPWGLILCDYTLSEDV